MFYQRQERKNPTVENIRVVSTGFHQERPVTGHLIKKKQQP
jgi:hypothetical protein